MADEKYHDEQFQAKLTSFKTDVGVKSKELGVFYIDVFYF